MASKYWEECFGWASGSLGGLAGCGVWKGICKGLGSFFRFAKFLVHNGEGMKFWWDPWCEREPLCNLFPSCYSLVEDKWRSVKDHMIWSRVLCS